MRPSATSFFAITFVVLAATAIGQESRQVDELEKHDDGELKKHDDGQADAVVVAFRGHATEVTSLAFSSDGSQAISTSENEVCIWESATGKEIRRLRVDGECVIAVHRDLRRLAIARSFHGDIPAARRGVLTLQDIANDNAIWSMGLPGI